MKFVNKMAYSRQIRKIENCQKRLTFNFTDLARICHNIYEFHQMMTISKYYSYKLSIK